MTKADLVRAVYEQHGALTKSEARAAVESILEITKKRLLGGQRILITNFGNFAVMERRKRRGRSPITGEIISIRPRRTLVFRPARKLDDRLNPVHADAGGGADAEE